MPGIRPLVVSDPSLVLRLDGERLLLLRQGQRIGAVPLHELSHVVLQGAVTLTGAVRTALLERGVEVTLLSNHGQYLGSTSSATSRNVFLMLAQVACWNDPARRLGVARVLVSSKIEGQRRLLLQHVKNRGSAGCRRAAEALEHLARQVPNAEDEEVLRGLEGSAAAAYFGVFGEMLSPPWVFPGRVRRPPTDPVNALLSYGYALLTGRMALLLQARSFDLRVGLFHGLRYGRVSLALDLIEEFRAPLVDRFVLKLLNRQQVGPHGFERDEATGGIRLALASRRLFLAAWESHLAAQETQAATEPEEEDALLLHVPRVRGVDDPGKRAKSWQHRMDRQVLRLRRFLLKGHPFAPLLGGPTSRDPGQGSVNPPPSPPATTEEVRNDLDAEVTKEHH